MTEAEAYELGRADERLAQKAALVERERDEYLRRLRVIARWWSKEHCPPAEGCKDCDVIDKALEGIEPAEVKP